MFGWIAAWRNAGVRVGVGWCNSGGVLPRSGTARCASTRKPCAASWARIVGMYSEQVLEHFRNPRNAGRLEKATAVVLASNPVCGDMLELAARVEAGRITEARFLCQGCTTAIACGSWVTERLLSGGVEGARALTAEEISVGLGGLPAATFHGAQLAAEAVGMLVKKVGGGE